MLREDSLRAAPPSTAVAEMESRDGGLRTNQNHHNPQQSCDPPSLPPRCASSPGCFPNLWVPHLYPGRRAEGAELVGAECQRCHPARCSCAGTHTHALFPSLRRRHSVSSVTVSFVARHRGSGRTLPSVPGGKIRIKGAIVLFSLQLTLIAVKGKL